jgi:small-conductance mechanosensitive channel
VETFFRNVADWFRSLWSRLPPDVLTRALHIGITIIAGLFILRLLTILTQRYIMRRSTAQRKLLAKKAIRYTAFVLILLVILRELGVELTTLLGAAGIAGVAIGFASQTSFSNIISGIFLISEKPFSLGDVIKVGQTTGIIQSIDLLSIKIRTFDNLFVRIPNEKILTSEVTNITRFPIRRMDITVRIGHAESLSKVKDVLMQIARENPFCLVEPEPVILFNEIHDWGIDVLYGLWFSKNDYMNLRNSIMIDITTRFREEGIVFPPSQTAVYLTRDAAAFPEAKEPGPH